MLLGVGVSAGCLWFAARGVDLGEVRAAFAAADYRTLPAILAALAGFFWLKAWRWALLLSPLNTATGEPFTAGRVLPATLIGFAGNNVLPAHAGEFFRVAVVARRWGVQPAAVLSTVVLERLLDVAAILPLFAAGLFAVPGAAGEYRAALAAVAAGLAAAAVGCGLFLWRTETCVRLAAAVLARLPLVPAGVRTGVPALLNQAAAGLAAVRNGRALALALSISVAHWALMAGMVWLSLAAFGARLPVAAGAVVNGVIAFGVLAPSTPGFFGVVQACFRAGHGPLRRAGGGGAVGQRLLPTHPVGPGDGGGGVVRGAASGGIIPSASGGERGGRVAGRLRQCGRRGEAGGRRERRPAVRRRGTQRRTRRRRQGTPPVRSPRSVAVP